jgi:hypothetical protein
VRTESTCCTAAKCEFSETYRALTFRQAPGSSARTLGGNLWRRASAAATLSLFQRGPMDRPFGNWALANSPIFLAKDCWPG